MKITIHGKKRIHERLGLPKRAHLKHIERVIGQGVLDIHARFGELKILYHGFIYIFKYSKTFEPIFITTYRYDSEGRYTSHSQRAVK